MLIVLMGVIVALIVLGIVLGIVLSKQIRRSDDSRLLRSLDDAPETAQIVVLGCPPIRPSGKTNRYFTGRIASAAAAYHHTPSRRILCSGRIDRDGIDEAAALADALEVAAVPDPSDMRR